MAINFNGSSAFMKYDYGSIITAAPCTIAAWFNTDTVSGAHTIVAAGGNKSGWAQEFSILLVNNAFWAMTSNGSGDSKAISTQAISTGTLYHGCGVFTAANSRAAYINGANKGTDTGSRTPDPAYMNLTRIGQRCGGADQKFDGMIAEVCIWTAAISEAEVAMLALGYSPLVVRPQNLFYWNLMGRYSAEIDLLHKNDMAYYGSPTQQDHIRVIYPG